MTSRFRRCRLSGFAASPSAASGRTSRALKGQVRKWTKFLTCHQESRLQLVLHLSDVTKMFFRWRFVASLVICEWKMLDEILKCDSSSIINLDNQYRALVYLNLGLSRPLFGFIFHFFVHWKITIDMFTMLNDDRQFETRRKSIILLHVLRESPTHREDW